MKVIDFHTHAFPDKIAEKAIRGLEEGSQEKALGNGTSNALLLYMEKSGIEYSILSSIATKPGQIDNIISWSLELKKENGAIIPFASFYPDENYKDSIDKIAKAGLAGIKLHPYYQKFIVDEERMKPIYEYICKKGMMILFHAGYDIAFEKSDIASAYRFRRIAELFPELDIIASHLGAWCMWEEVLEHLAGTCVFLDTAYIWGYIKQETFDLILKRHDESKVLFGTDFPWSDPAEDIKKINSLCITDDYKQKILYNNAKSLLAKHKIHL